MSQSYQTHMTVIYPCKYSTSLGISQQAGNCDREMFGDEMTEVETVSKQQIIDREPCVTMSPLMFRVIVSWESTAVSRRALIGQYFKLHFRRIYIFASCTQKAAHKSAKSIITWKQLTSSQLCCQLILCDVSILIIILVSKGTPLWTVSSFPNQFMLFQTRTSNGACLELQQICACLYVLQESVVQLSQKNN